MFNWKCFDCQSDVVGGVFFRFLYRQTGLTFLRPDYSEMMYGEPDDPKFERNNGKSCLMCRDYKKWLPRDRYIH